MPVRIALSQGQSLDKTVAPPIMTSLLEAPESLRLVTCKVFEYRTRPYPIMGSS